jgi:hypothetical protein
LKHLSATGRRIEEPWDLDAEPGNALAWELGPPGPSRGDIGPRQVSLPQREVPELLVRGESESVDVDLS